MCNKEQGYYQSQQPPALGGEPEVIGYRCRQSETENWIMSTTPGYWEHKPVVLLDDHRAHVAPLLAEIERLRLQLETMTADRDAEKSMKATARMQRDTLNARREELEKADTCWAAVIEYVLGDGLMEEPLEFLRQWSMGEFDVLRKEWPDAPKEIYLADPLTEEKEDA